MTTASTSPDGTTTNPRTGRTRVRALSVLGAVLAALAVWVVAVPVLGVDLSASPGGGSTQVVGAGAVVATSLVAGLLGWGLLAVLERRSARAGTIWTGIALTVLLLSLVGPLTGSDSRAAAVVFVLLHVAVAGVLIPVFRGSSSGRGGVRQVG